MQAQPARRPLSIHGPRGVARRFAANNSNQQVQHRVAVPSGPPPARTQRPKDRGYRANGRFTLKDYALSFMPLTHPIRHRRYIRQPLGDAVWPAGNEGDPNISRPSFAEVFSEPSAALLRELRLTEEAEARDLAAYSEVPLEEDPEMDDTDLSLLHRLKVMPPIKVHAGPLRFSSGRYGNSGNRRARKMFANESEEDREARLARYRQAKAIQRMNRILTETPQQREERLRRQRIRQKNLYHRKLGLAPPLEPKSGKCETMSSAEYELRAQEESFQSQELSNESLNYQEQQQQQYQFEQQFVDQNEVVMLEDENDNARDGQGTEDQHQQLQFEQHEVIEEMQETVQQQPDSDDDPVLIMDETLLGE